MKLLACLLIAFSSVMASAQTTPAKPEPVEHTFIIHNFHTESGVTLPEAKILYGTYGHLNAAGDNAILLPSHYMADMYGYEWLIGPGKALDPARQFLITSELFGNGRSSSPSNTPEPFHGPRFPVTTIRDNVEAVHQLLTQELGVRHLQAVIGFSMGAQQAFQWAVSYPGYMDRIVATSGTAKTYGHGIVRLESEITAMTTDEAFKSWRLQGGTGQRHPGICPGLDGLALFAGVVARGAMEIRGTGRHHLRPGCRQIQDEFHSWRRRQQSHPADAHLGEA